MTQMGIEAKAAPKWPKMPRQMSQKAHEKPAEREAHLVSAMRPLFCEKVVLGGEPNRQAKMELTPAARAQCSSGLSGAHGMHGGGGCVCGYSG